MVAIVSAGSTRDEASESWELLTSPVGRPAQAGDEEFENLPCQNKVSVLAKAGCCARMTSAVRRQGTNSGRAASVKFTSAAPFRERRFVFLRKPIEIRALRVSRWIYAADRMSLMNLVFSAKNSGFSNPFDGKFAQATDDNP